MRDIGSGITNISAHLSHDTDMFVTVKQREFFFFSAWLSAMSGSVGLEGGI